MKKSIKSRWMLNDYGYYMKRNVMHGKASNIFLIKSIKNLLIYDFNSFLNLKVVIHARQYTA